jgi:molecular chaperone GrpE
MSKKDKIRTQDKPAKDGEDVDASKTTSTASTEDLSLQQELAEQKDKYVRLLAEFDNARKRQERERMEYIKYANEGLMRSLLDIVDDLERTVMAAKEKHQDYDSFLKGVEMVMKQVADLLKKQGVEAIDPTGEPFDPYAHEIIMQEPCDDHDNGVVIESIQKGYKLGDRVIRTAKVKIAMNNKEHKDT